jgi:hypothetical protein
MSGYTDAIIADRGMLMEGEELIQKPFTAATLLGKVAQMLDDELVAEKTSSAT